MSDNKNVASVYGGRSFSHTKERSRHALYNMDRTGNLLKNLGWRQLRAGDETIECLSSMHETLDASPSSVFSGHSGVNL